MSGLQMDEDFLWPLEICEGAHGTLPGIHASLDILHLRPLVVSGHAY